MVGLKLVDAPQAFLPPVPAALRSPSHRRRSHSAPGCFAGRRPHPGSKPDLYTPFRALLDSKNLDTRRSTCVYSLHDKNMMNIGNVDDVSSKDVLLEEKNELANSWKISLSMESTSTSFPEHVLLCQPEEMAFHDSLINLANYSMQPIASAMPCVSSRCIEALTPVMEQGLHETFLNILQGLIIAYLDPATAKLAVTFTGPFLSAFGFSFILRIVMSWYPKLSLTQFPYVIAYAPTEPILSITRKLIPPLDGVDVTPVVWFGLVSF